MVSVKPKRNYAKENKWESSDEQVHRRVARNRARRKAIAAGRAHKGDGKELDHQGFHPHGSLDHVPVRLVSRHANRVRQPPHKSRSSK